MVKSCLGRFSVLGMALLGLNETLNFVTVSAWPKLKSFSSRGAAGLCDCVSVFKTQVSQFSWCCWALRLCQCVQNSSVSVLVVLLGLNDNFVWSKSFFVTVSVWSKLKSFSSHCGIGLCDCVSVVNTQVFQFSWYCWALRLSVWSKLKCFSSRGAVGPCDCQCGQNSNVSVLVVLLGLATVSVVKTQVFQLPWCCWALRLSVWSTLKSFSSRCAIWAWTITLWLPVWSELKCFSSCGAMWAWTVNLALCVVKIQVFQVLWCYLGLNDKPVTVSQTLWSELKCFSPCGSVELER